MTEFTNRKWHSGMLSQEDWWAVWLGLTFFSLGLLTLFGVDIIGWVAYPKKWVFSIPEGIVSKKIVTAENAFYALGGKYSLTAKTMYQGLGAIGSVLVTYLVLSIATTIGAYFMKWDVKKFFKGWTIIFFLTYLTWFIGNHAFFAATIVDLKKSNMPDMFSLSLGGGASYVLALAVGLIIGNFFKPFAEYLYEAVKPERYIKTAIVFLGVKGGYLPIKAAATSLNLAQEIADLTFESTSI
jgi:hypothetical protein